MKKCDVIIPVYNAPDYTKLCVYALFKNTNIDTINKVYLMNDNSNLITRNMLENLKQKYGDKIELINNKNNLGFIKNVNLGMSMCTADYVLLLNTDCLIGKNTIERLMNHMINDKKIGLICPLSNNSANLSLPMYPGFSYMMMDELLYSKFSGVSYDACTVVGNCLMISKKCIDTVGYLDEIYGMGYCDETDYQFKAMKKGFSAKVALDSYVYHKAEQSFNTTNESRNSRLERNRKIFFDRWGKQYYKLLEEYNKNDPIEFVNNNITRKDKQVNFDFMFVCMQNNSSSGGIRVIVDLINYLSINGKKVGLLNLYGGEYNEIILFRTLTPYDMSEVKSKFLISTIYASTFFTKKMAEKMKAKHLYFSQGYEFAFDNGMRYGECEMSFKTADYLLTISNYLKREYKNMFNIDAHLIPNGIDIDLALSAPVKENQKTIMMVLRNEPRKADYQVLDLIKKLSIKFDNIVLNIVNNNKNAILPVNTNDSVTINYFDGPITRSEMYDLLRKSDIFIDTSLSEGFGLIPLEAMACGCVPIISNSFGIGEYANDGSDCYVINEVNDPDKYIEKIEKLLADDKLLYKMKMNAYNNAKKYDFDSTVEEYIKYFDGLLVDNKSNMIKQSYTTEEVVKLSEFLYSNDEYKQLMEKLTYVNLDNSVPVIKKRSRMSKIATIIKEFIKANVFLIKIFLKVLLKNIEI